MTKRQLVLGFLVLACLLVGVVATLVGPTGPPGRQGEDQAVGSTISTSEQARSPEPPTTTTGSSAEAAGPASCPPGGPTPRGPTPRGNVALSAADIDGDGAGDTVYLLDEGDQPDRAVGVALATGHRSETAFAEVIASSIFGPFDLNGDGRDELLNVSSGNTGSTTLVQVVVLEGCELVIARNVEGEPYRFLVSDHGFEGLSDASLGGVGCVDVDVDGQLDLVGLAGYREAGDRVRWTRTVVRLEDAVLRNGPTDGGVFVAGVDDAAIASLGQVSCRDELGDPIVSD